MTRPDPSRSDRSGAAADHPVDLLGALALDAVDDVERRCLMRHVNACAECRDEYDTLVETAATLSTATAPVPDALRERVLAGTRRRPRARRLLVAAAVGAVVAGGVGVGVWTATGPDTPPGVTQEDGTMDRVLAAPDMEKATGALGDGTVAAMYAPSVRATVVSVTDLPATEPAMGYQVWITVDGKVKSAGMVDRDGSSVLMTDMSRPAAVGLSVEPMTGSDAPSSPMVVTFPMP